MSQAKGSAYIEVGNTKVICSAFDPREIPNNNKFSLNGELFCDFKFANFSQKKRRGFIRDAEEKDLSVCLKRALEPAVCRHEFPNFQVDVYAVVLEDDGSALAAAITCASLALADASIPMYDLVTALTMGVHGDYKFLDPTSEEERLCCHEPPGQNKNHGLIVLAYATELQQVTQLKQIGVMDSEFLIEASNSLSSHCSQTHKISQQSLAQAVLKTTNEKKRLLELGETFKKMDVSSEQN